MKPTFRNDVCVVGGAGHIGLPLALVLARKGLNVSIYDINKESLDRIRSGVYPFMEVGGEEYLKEALVNHRLILSTNLDLITNAKVIIVTIGTPVDEFLNPMTYVIQDLFDKMLPFLLEDQLIILRSTVYPGTTEWLYDYLCSQGKRMKLAFCPERVVQGHAIEEIQSLGQIVSGISPEAEQEASTLFEMIAPEVVHLSPKEAEFAKLFTNAYRYIQFAAANQFYMIASSAGVDYNHVLRCLKKNYPRSEDMSGAGFAAGPCLFKDTMQLSAFSNNQFSLGHAAMLVNEGLVFFIIEKMKNSYNLCNLTVGLLGMAFKADCDDTRASLSYKLKKLLIFNARRVLTTDPFVTTDPSLLPVEQVIAESDILILCVPHSTYRHLDLRGKPIVDIWDYLGNGDLIKQFPERDLES
jgi:UDP-N-acetyl-D-mannosaminuronic acid dehydrogenase